MYLFSQCKLNNLCKNALQINNKFLMHTRKNISFKNSEPCSNILFIFHDLSLCFTSEEYFYSININEDEEF